MSQLYQMQNRKSFGYSAENPTGVKGGGSKGKDCEKLNPCIDIEPEEIVTLCDIDGPGMITHIWFTGYVGHSFILRVYWDMCEKPSIETPVNAFFGCAYDENFEDRDGRYPVLNSSVILVAPGRGLNSYWEMPFQKHCRITMENRSKEKKTLFYMISGWRGEVLEHSGYFHAAYRQEHPVQKGRSFKVISDIKGKGCFVGMSLAVGINGSNTCWVEGEAKMYIDGDRYPTMNYTGTEDYFCGSYAFGNDVYHHEYQTFSGAYAGMYAIIGDNGGLYNQQQRFLLYRWHIKDPIYFEKDFSMVLDNLGWTGSRYDDYTTCACWYLAEPSQLPLDLPNDEEMIMK